MKNLYINLKKDYKNYLNLLILYSISQLWIIFLGNSIYWDDWHFHNIGNENIYNTSIMLGAPIRGFIVNIFFPFGFIFMRFITFILFFTNSILLDKILKRIKIINENNRFIICLLFLITPLYLARITFAVFPYTLCTFFFFFAWFILPKNKLFSLLLFFISFATNSLLVFYTLPILEIFLNNYKFKIKSIMRFFKNNLFFLILPFVYYSIKFSFFRPYGIFENYNETFNLKFLFFIPLYQISDALNFKSSLILFIPLAVLIFTFIFYKYIPIKYSLNDQKYSKEIFLLGILSLFLGLFPYWILGHTPQFNDIWNTRHQLLMPLGIALISSSILSRFEIGSRRVFLSLIVTISILINQTNYFDLLNDHKKQLNIITQLSNFPLNENTDILIFEDATIEDNAFNRKYRFYEWQGITNRAYPKNKKIIGIGENHLVQLKNIFESNQQNYWGFKIKTLPEKINIANFKILYKESNPSELTKLKKFSKILFNSGNLKIPKIELIDYNQISKKDLT